jgi:RNA polymerase primary sigma factor
MATENWLSNLEVDVERCNIRDLMQFADVLDRPTQFAVAHTYRLEGSPEDRERLIRAGVRWVIKLAYVYGRKYRVMNLFLDLVQEGLIGLMIAVEKYQPETGFTLCTYGSCWIKQKMALLVIHEAESVRISNYARIKASNLQGVIKGLQKMLDRQPTDEEVVAAGFKREDLQYLRGTEIHVQSLSEPAPGASDSDDFTLADVIPDPRSAEEFLEGLSSKMSREKIVSFLENTFPARQASLVIEHYALSGGAEKTLEELGKEWGITRERVRQLIAKTLKDGKFTWFMAKVFYKARKVRPEPVM